MGGKVHSTAVASGGDLIGGDLIGCRYVGADVPRDVGCPAAGWAGRRHGGLPAVRLEPGGSRSARVVPGLVLGSHLDSVPDGGAYDGPLGVVSAFLALDELRARGFTPDRPVAIANFVDEEGARFGIALAGSRVLTGLLDPDKARGLTDADGITMADALRAAGRDPAIAARARAR